MSDWKPMPIVDISPVEKEHGVLAMGSSVFGWSRQDDADSLDAMDAALRCGMSHFDTAASYGGGHSKQLVGQFLEGKRRKVFLATKGVTSEMSPQAILRLVDQRFQRLRTDVIDLYYIHWPCRGKDMRPLMERLERACHQGRSAPSA